MLSTMTTSENFPLNNQSRYPRSPFKSVIQPNYVPAILLQSPQIVTAKDESVLNCRLIPETGLKNGKLPPTICYYSTDSKKESLSFFEDSDEVSGEIINGGESDLEVPKIELENELTEILEQIEIDDSVYEQSKPLKIDPNVLKLDFSKLVIKGNHETLDNLHLTDFLESKRASSEHLSGFPDLEKDSSKNRFCKLSGGSLVTTENVFKFENFSDSDTGSGGLSNFLNQISPSSPLTFDLTAQNDQEKNVTDGVSPEAESTNPFKNFIKADLEEEKSFSPTNPFSDFCGSSSLNEIPSITCLPPKYENISLPQKSFSQCSTRPASPVLKIPEESSVSNPFLINETSLEPYPSSTAPQSFINESNFENSKTSALPHPSSFIFAVPVFPIFQHNITNSSTQTGDISTSEGLTSEEPVYQNVSNQLKKFMKTNDHSEYDLQCLKTTVKDLRNSGWYYENVSWQESVILLKHTEPGTFLIRDSSDPNFLFSLSVQTSRGPTSVRLHYVNGLFRLDAEERLIPHMPSFNSVIELIDYYVENTVKNKSNGRTNKSSKKPGKHKLQKSKDQVWIDSQGNVYSNILLVKPLYKRTHFSSLQHLARLSINGCIKKRLNAKVKYNFRVTPVYESSPFQDSSFQNNFDNFCPTLNIDALPLPSKLLEFLKEYPYCH